MNVEQVYVLAKLCIEYMYELHDFYNEVLLLIMYVQCIK